MCHVTDIDARFRDVVSGWRPAAGSQTIKLCRIQEQELVLCCIIVRNDGSGERPPKATRPTTGRHNSNTSENQSAGVEPSGPAVPDRF